MLPLQGIKIADFSTLLPGPLASLILAEAGADIIKIERPGAGDEMRRYAPFHHSDNPNFAVLNRGKRSVSADLRNPADLASVRDLLRGCDVLIEQFRPGVMQRLGLGYAAVHALNPRLIYCSITGYGQTGPKAAVAAHDLNYIAETGLLGLSGDRTGTPIVPSAQVADIGGGTLPAVINILLALRQVEATGQGAWLDISMCDNIFCWQSWAMSQGEAAGQWPKPGSESTTGGSPRYQVYRTADDRFLSVAPLEDRFWTNFCDVIGLDPQWRDDQRDPARTIGAVAERIATRTAADWQTAFAGVDVCCAVVATVQEAASDPHFTSRGLFDRRVRFGGASIAALPMPLADAFRRPETELGYPETAEPIAGSAP
jgi:alpha-methylacyl-CoA racemase